MSARTGPVPCNFLAPTVIESSRAVGPEGIVRRICWYAAPIYRRVLGVLSPGAPADVNATGARPVPEIAPLDLEPGEWVEVRPIEEINETLDAGQRCRGLYFMPAMQDFCGGRFRVFKRVNQIRLEETGEVRHLKTPSVFLEGVYCNGERHQGCDRGCFHFWREAWLRRSPDREDRQESVAPCAETR